MYSANTADCAKGNGIIFGYKRAVDGTLAQLAIHPTVPKLKAPSEWSCPVQAAADATNHVAIPIAPMSGLSQVGNAQIAVYTATSTGGLTGSNNASVMPATTVGRISTLRMSASGTLLAVGGSAGVQVFHFNGASPATHFTNRLTTVAVDRVFWDNSNHVYAISNAAGKLFVWTVTGSSVSAAPGSPHTITHPQDLVVVPK